MPKLHPDVKRYIERELYNYDRTLQDIDFEREYIIDRSPVHDGQPKGSGVSDPTGRAAWQLLANADLHRMTQTINQIDSALDKLGGDYRILFDMRYRRYEHDDDIMCRLRVEKSKYYGMKNRLLLAVALEMGFKNHIID